MTSERYSRQSFLGENGQANIERTVLGFVGLGGGGSHMVQQFAHVGVQHFVVFDDDTVDESNLNRLVTAEEADVAAQTPKTETANVRRLVSIREPLPPGTAELYQDPARAMFAVAVAMSIQSRLFGDSRLSFTDLVTTDHPPDRWRQLMVLNIMGSEADGFWGGPVSKQIEAAVNRAIAEVEEAFERMTGEPQQVHGLHDVSHGPGWDYCKALCCYWNDEVKAKAADHAFTDLRTYSFDWPKS